MIRDDAIGRTGVGLPAVISTGMAEAVQMIGASRFCPLS